MYILLKLLVSLPLWYIPPVEFTDFCCTGGVSALKRKSGDSKSVILESPVRVPTQFSKAVRSGVI